MGCLGVELFAESATAKNLLILTKLNTDIHLWSYVLMSQENMLVEGIFNAPGCSECLHLGEIHKKQSDTWNTQNPTPLEPNIKAANGISTFCCCRLLCLRSLFLGDEKISWTLLLRLTLDSSWQSAWETKCCGKTGEMYTQEWKLKSLSVSLSTVWVLEGSSFKKQV